MKRDRNIIFLDRADVIRANLLARHRDYAGFDRWWESIDSEEQLALIAALCEFAYQAGVTDETYVAASVDSGISASDDSIIVLKRVKDRDGTNVAGLKRHLKERGVEYRRKAFVWFRHLFIVAEETRRNSEDKRKCNHWWHRNLDDPRVVEDLMNDREFYRTSPKNDVKFE